jgi:hypothetical protein
LLLGSARLGSAVLALWSLTPTLLACSSPELPATFEERTSALEVAVDRPGSVCNAVAPTPALAIDLVGMPGSVDVSPGGALTVRLASTASAAGIAVVRAYCTTDAGRGESEVIRADLAAGATADHRVTSEALGLQAGVRGHLTLWGSLELDDGRREASHATLLAFQPTERGWTVFDDVGREALRQAGALQAADREAELLARVPAGVVADDISPVTIEPLAGEAPPPDGPPDPDGEGAP